MQPNQVSRQSELSNPSTHPVWLHLLHNTTSTNLQNLLRFKTYDLRRAQSFVPEPYECRELYRLCSFPGYWQGVLHLTAGDPIKSVAMPQQELWD